MENIQITVRLIYILKWLFTARLKKRNLPLGCFK